jgi:orotidine-5'-phosphate decarboxylase
MSGDNFGGEDWKDMSYVDKLKASANETGSIVCMGLDPVLEAIPKRGSTTYNSITDFYGTIFNRMNDEGTWPGAFKPNQGFFEKHDKPLLGEFEGSEALVDVMHLIRELNPRIPIILDYKRGDIATSSTNYAGVGVNWGADALTVAPYMGTDSVMPFVKTGKGIYVLGRTSNPGGADFQNLRTIKQTEKFSEGLCRVVQQLIESGNASYGRLLNANIMEYIEREAPFLYEAVADKILEWGKDYKNAGAVFGATVPEELMHKAKFFADNNMMLLIPGVGGQGGSVEQVMLTLNNARYPLELARINSSSGLTHPWKTADKAPEDYAGEVVNKLRELNAQIGYVPK